MSDDNGSDESKSDGGGGEPNKNLWVPNINKIQIAEADSDEDEDDDDFER